MSTKNFIENTDFREELPCELRHVEGLDDLGWGELGAEELFA